MLINQSLLDGFTMRGQKSSTDVLNKNMEEISWVFDAFKVMGDVQPDVEAPPLAPDGGAFLEYRRQEPLEDCLLCSIVVSCHLHLDGRGSRCQGFLCGKWVRKWERKCHS